ncbi:MAG: ATP-dependent helicase HrpB [Ignavibacteriae bacterium]|nr:ATP-dependent helicase HrpB [Ignavibacteriota bacterium]
MLPIENILPELRSTLQTTTNVVLSAEPGAGKTTRVPIALMNESWLSGKKIIMLEPRRLAAQRAASYMAQQIHENVGATIGYRIRGDAKVGAKTRIEVVTEGILTRMIQSEPDLSDVGLLIFDEFHERSIHADLGLALALDVQEQLRDDLRILVMSATLDGISISSLLGNAPVLQSAGRTFPITTHYLKRVHDGAIEPLIVSAIHQTIKEDEGDVLVFLPGQREIRRVESLLLDKELPEEIIIHTLFGEASPKQQQTALATAPNGKRKIILSTSIAETSLTIDGVQVVIDSGLARVPRFDSKRGMSGLVTTQVSQANAEQRRGRAGRQAPGVCYRLWTEQQQTELPKFLSPEILVSDLAPFALELARWGDAEAKRLRFLDAPSEKHLTQARTLLTQLGAFDAKGKLTPHGKAMAELPVHPRLAHMLLKGKELHFGSMACDVAALLEERDILRGENDSDIDLASRWHVLETGKGASRFALERAQEQSVRLRHLLNVRHGKSDEKELGLLLALAYPERVARRRDSGEGRYQMVSGTGALLPKKSMLSREEFLAIGEVDGIGSEVKIFLAAPLSEKQIRLAFDEQLTEAEEVHWDEREESVVARKITRLGALELSVVPLSTSSEKTTNAMLDGIRLLGLDALPWTKDANSIRTRNEWLRIHNLTKSSLPNVSNEYLLETLGDWLAPYLSGITRRVHLQKLDMSMIVRAMFSFEQLREVERLAPTHLTVPTGSHIPIDYSGEQPVLAVRLQEMFGETETPTVANGKVKVLLHLLSPAHRPLAITQDLPSFWKNAYPDVRKDMRGRYPKHYWPENPKEAEPTRRTKRR